MKFSRNGPGNYSIDGLTEVDVKIVEKLMEPETLGSYIRRKAAENYLLEQHMPVTNETIEAIVEQWAREESKQ